MKEREPRFMEKVKLYYEQNKPFNKSDAAKRFAKLPTKGPMDLLRQGAPSFTKMKIFSTLGSIWLVIVFWVTTTEDVYFDPRTIADVSMSGTLVLLGLLTAAVWVGRDLQKGAFSDYDKQIEPLMWRDILTKQTKPGALRVKKAIQIWPPTSRTRAMVNALQEQISKAESKLKEKEPGDKKKKSESTEPGSPTASTTAPEDVPSPNSSLYKLRQIIRRHRQIDPEAQRQQEPFSPKDEFVKLVQKYIILFNTIQFDYYVTILECAGDIYPLVISVDPLFESADTRGDWTQELLDKAEEDDKEPDQPGYVEIRRHSFKQRTYIYQGENNNASWSVFSVLDWYKYYIQPPKLLRWMRLKKYEQRINPICFVSASDSTCERRENNIKAMPTPLPADAVQQTRNIYDAALSEELISFSGLVVTENERLENEQQKSEEMFQAKLKAMLGQILQDMIISGKAGGQSIVDRAVFLFKHRTIKLLAYLFLAFCAIFFLIYVISAVTGTPMPWPFNFGTGDAYIPGNGTAVSPNTP